MTGAAAGGGGDDRAGMGLSFSYDGFGNRTAQTVIKGSGPTSSVNVDPNTNRITSYGYDQNGNMVTNPASAGGTLSYDVENQLAAVYPSAGGGEMYGYTGDNKRVYKRLPARVRPFPRTTGLFIRPR